MIFMTVVAKWRLAAFVNRTIAGWFWAVFDKSLVVCLVSKQLSIYLIPQELILNVGRQLSSLIYSSEQARCSIKYDVLNYDELNPFPNARKNEGGASEGSQQLMNGTSSESSNRCA